MVCAISTSKLNTVRDCALHTTDSSADAFHGLQGATCLRDRSREGLTVQQGLIAERAPLPPTSSSVPCDSGGGEHTHAPVNRHELVVFIEKAPSSVEFDCFEGCPLGLHDANLCGAQQAGFDKRT